MTDYSDQERDTVRSAAFGAMANHGRTPPLHLERPRSERRCWQRNPDPTTWLSGLADHFPGRSSSKTNKVSLKWGGRARTRDQRITNNATHGNARRCLSYLVSEQIWSPKPSGDDDVIPADSRSLTVNKR
jgi:hypothetical protein